MDRVEERMTEQQAADQVWDALMKLSEIAARSRHQQRELYPLIRQIVDAVVARGVRAPGTGLFVPCPVCNAMVGQRCITIPGHILHDSIHPERVELCKETIGR
ncbi:zinc finger domain-containing protein [Micromonospora aurantiaca (nom. illeg.)]